MEIRKLQDVDLEMALELVWQVFMEFEGSVYTKKGISTFKNFIAYDSIQRRVSEEKLILWGCFKAQELTGVIAISDGKHISLLFVKKEYQRQGIARRLFQTVIDYCRKHTISRQITVNSSPYAVEAYHRLGFRDINEEQTLDGIKFTPMVWTMPEFISQF